MATSRSRGSSGSRSGRKSTVGSDYYNDESPDVILPTSPPGSRGSGKARSGSGGSGRAGSGRTASRGGTSVARNNAGGRISTTGRSGGAAGGGGPRRKGAAPAKIQPTDNLLVLVIGWVLRAVATAWLLVAFIVGGMVRRFDRNARELHPDHKRDGFGLVCLGLAIVCAVGIWARIYFAGLYVVTSAAVGDGAFTIPILFALAGLRFMRHPDRDTALPPAAIGWTALLVGGLGLFHIARGVPTLSHGGGGWPAVRTAGGLVGMAASWPLDKGLTAWVATPLLGLLAAYGLLVITGTPVRQVPERLTELRVLFGLAAYDDEWDGAAPEGQDGDGTVEDGARRGEINRGPIRLKGSLESGDQRKPYDPQVLLPGTGLPPARVPEARIGDDLLEDLGFTTQTDRAESAHPEPVAFQPALDPGPQAGPAAPAAPPRAVPPTPVRP